MCECGPLIRCLCLMWIKKACKKKKKRSPIYIGSVHFSFKILSSFILSFTCYEFQQQQSCTTYSSENVSFIWIRTSDKWTVCSLAWIPSLGLVPLPFTAVSTVPDCPESVAEVRAQITWWLMDAWGPLKQLRWLQNHNHVRLHNVTTFTSVPTLLHTILVVATILLMVVWLANGLQREFPLCLQILSPVHMLSISASFYLGSWGSARAYLRPTKMSPVRVEEQPHNAHSHSCLFRSTNQPYIYAFKSMETGSPGENSWARTGRTCKPSQALNCAI